MMAVDFGHRSNTEELMDTELAGFDELRACLVDLTQVNGLTLAYRPTLAFFDRLAERGLPKGRPLEVVDVGSGYGDMLRKVDAWAQRRGVAVSLTGIDLNPLARSAAVEATPRGRPIRWITANAFAYDPPSGIDVVISSLFTHHLTDPEVTRFLAWMEASARLGWFVNDLHRHPLPYHFFRHFAKVARYHRFVQHDGPVSVARAFVRNDWRGLLALAGVPEGAAQIAWWLPFRFCVERFKDPL